ncbi:MAG: hypothetical protein ABEJ57_07630 [Halobacteriaceae archaeon]
MATITDDRHAHRPAPRRWEIGRLLLGTMYLLGAIAHFWLGIAAPEIYEEFADQALLTQYTGLWQTLVVPNL